MVLDSSAPANRTRSRPFFLIDSSGPSVNVCIPIPSVGMLHGRRRNARAGLQNMARNYQLDSTLQLIQGPETEHSYDRLSISNITSPGYESRFG